MELGVVVGVQLYRNLAAGTSVRSAFDLARIAVTTAWPDRAEPYLAGDGARVPLPR